MANDSYTILNKGVNGNVMDESAVTYNDGGPTQRQRARVVISSDNDPAGLASPVSSSLSVTGSTYAVPARLVGQNPVVVYGTNNAPVSVATEPTLSTILARTPPLGSAPSANSVPVVIAPDQPPIQVKVMEGAANIAVAVALQDVTASFEFPTGSAGTPSPGVLTVQGISGMTPLFVTGSVDVPGMSVVFPAVQTITGSVWAAQSGSWSIDVSNFPSTQTVTGTITAVQPMASALNATVVTTGGLTVAKDTTLTDKSQITQVAYGGSAIDPRSIRALTSSDVVTAAQSTASNLNATVVTTGGAALAKESGGNLDSIATNTSNTASRLPSAFTSGGGLKAGLVDALPTGTNTIGAVTGPGAVSLAKDSTLTDKSQITQVAYSGSAIDPRSIRTLTSADTVTANAGTGTFAVSAASLPLPANAAQETGGNLATLAGKDFSTSAKQDTGNSSLSSIDGKLPTTLGQKTSAGSLSITLASDQATATTPLSMQLIASGSIVDPRVVRALTSADEVTVSQTTASSLNATVVTTGGSTLAKESGGNLDSITTNTSNTASRLPTAFTSGGGVKVGLVDALPAGSNAIGSVTASQSTASNFNATVVTTGGAALAKEAGGNLDSIATNTSNTASRLPTAFTSGGGVKTGIVDALPTGANTIGAVTGPGAVDLAKDSTLTDKSQITQVAYSGSAIDPRSIRTLTSSDVVTAAQATASSLNATVVTTGGATLAKESGGNLDSITTNTSNTASRLPTAFTAGGGVKVGVVDSLPAGSNSIGSVAQGTAAAGTAPWPVQMGSPTTSPLTNAAITISSSGNNTVIAGVVSQTVRVFSIFLVASGPVSITIRDGTSTSLTGAMPFNTGGAMVLDPAGLPWFTTTGGNGFVINLSAAVTVTGFIQYTQS